LPNGSRATKKVILISATPLNNAPQDIANLIYLFQDAKNSTLETSNLQHFFRKKIDAFQKLKKDPDHDKIRKEVKVIYDEIRNKVIEPLIVRRTRTDLKDNEFYKKDLEEQGIVFPDVQKPEKIFYILDEALDALYDRTIRDLSHPTEGLCYNRYRAIQFLTPLKKSKYKNADLISGQLAKIMKTLLVKRLDSSFHAFSQSLRRFKEATDAMVKMFEAGTIYIAPNLQVSEYINDDREDELIKLIAEQSVTDPSIEICAPDDFQDGFLDGLRHDQKILTELVAAWQKVHADPKLDEFARYLNDRLFDKKINREGKLVVFSESKETTNYLKSELGKRGFDKILCVDSHNRRDLMPTVLANFDANFKGEKKDDFDIVISTEVLAEGINLHRANVIVNYDTPWNATRLMQRIGRVNRIGSLAPQIHIFNFFPTAKVNKDIELEKKAMMKLTAFHAALGEDSGIYSPDEEFTTFGLFDKDLDEDRDEKLTYLFEIRKIKEEQPEFFKKIENMPLRARVGRKHKIMRGSTLTFVRSQHRDAFYYVREDGSQDEFTFLEAVREFHARPSEKAIALHDRHHDQVKAAIAAFDQKVEVEKARDKKLDGDKAGPNETKALEYLEGFLSLPFISEKEKALVLQAKTSIRAGTFQNLQRQVNQLQRNVKKAPLRPADLLDALLGILKSYPLDKMVENTPSATPMLLQKVEQPDIIISESFNAG
jgi:superfamily II DNA/RNA helicase